MSLRQEADLQLRIRQQQKADQIKQNQMEDRKMLKHLKHEIERDNLHNQQKKENLKKISQENKHSSLFKKNLTQHSAQEDQAVARKAALDHDHGFKIQF